LNANEEGSIFTGVKGDTVGPGQYNLKNFTELNRQKGPGWAKSKVSKLAPAVPKEKERMVGPGSYIIII
jgi:hypothetical protein